MRHLDLFSGIGGFALAASWVWPDHQVIEFVEKDPYCQKILKKHWPDVPICGDIHDWKPKPADLVTGGFPCQPFSVAGKQRGSDDDRYLWPAMLEVIRRSQPTWVVGENVAGIVNMALDQVLADLEMEGYACQSFIIPACAVDAPHRRDRVWIVAHSESERTGRPGDSSGKGTCTHAGSMRLQERDRLRPRKHEADAATQAPVRWPTEPAVCRVAHGIPNRVHRLRALGNAIVPQVAKQIFITLKESRV